MGFARKFRRKSNAGKSMYGAIPYTMYGAEKIKLKPDAGTHSKDGINHYFMETIKFAEELYSVGKIATYKDTASSPFVCELTTSVDIMDVNGKTHIVPQVDGGYLASFKFSKQMLNKFADQIDNGSSYVRIDGVPNKTDKQINDFGKNTEKFYCIDVVDCWGPGNIHKHLNLMLPFKGIFTNTKEIAKQLRQVADKL